MRKKAVLIILFVIPIVVYLFFASGVYNFARLPVITSSITWQDFFINSECDTVRIKGKISVIGFLGNVNEEEQIGIFNLNEKIGKRFGEFNDFQFLFFYNEGQEKNIAILTNKLGRYNDLSKWNFVSLKDIQHIHSNLQTNKSLDNDGYTPLVYILDKEGKLRGRSDDEDFGMLYGYNTNSVAELSNKMVDDVKVILAEYRLALKKYNKRSF